MFRLSIAAAALLVLPTAAPAQSKDDCTEADHAAMAAWFPQDQSPPPTTALASDSLCAFHVWAAQAFLYLTQTDPDTGLMRLLGWNTIDELFAPRGAVRVARTEAPLRLTPRVSKSNEVDVSATLQAGSAGVLVDRNGRVIYYEQLFNNAFRAFVEKRFYGDGAGAGFDPARMAAATGLDEFFPAGVIELKTSWMIVDDGDPAYLTAPAEVHLLKVEDGRIVVDPDNTAPATLGLVGLHIAGVVEDHPEMIWATFEHRGNSPVLPAGLSPDSTEPVSAENYTFYAANTPAREANRNPVNVLTLDPATQVLSPVTQVFRQFDHGIPDGAIDGDVNAADIELIDGFLAKGFAPADAPASHYTEVGAVWMTPNSLEPDQFPITQLRGSTMLSNATVETYTQNDQQCFSCHNTLPQSETVNGARVTLPGTNFNISHALVQEYFRARATERGVAVRALR